jgi:hypothetical protein
MKATLHRRDRMKAALLVLLALVVLMAWRAHQRKGNETGSPSPRTVQVEDRPRPDAAPGRGARLARAGSSRDAIGEAPEELAAGQTVDPDPSSANPEYRLRRARHKWVKLYLTTPARGTEAFAQIEALCREYGYGPWAVGPAYTFAWEMAAFDRMQAAFASGDNGERSRELLAVVEADQSERLVSSLFDAYGVADLPADFLTAARRVQPVVFFGHDWEAWHQRGEELLDALSWEEAQASATK